MRRLPLIALGFILLAAAQRAPQTPPGHTRCCATKVYDATGKEIGEVMKYDERFQSVPLNAWVRYELKGGDSVAINVGPESFNSPIGGGGSNIVFTSSDCSGDAFLAGLANPTLTKRYAVILPGGGPGSYPFQLTHAWLYVTDPFPTRVDPGATVFHSQWDYNNSCTTYPAPGLTFPGNQYGFWAKKVEDLYVKFKRPFWIP